jgi:hypothetical protein
VVEHQVDDHPDAAVLRRTQEVDEVAQAAEPRIDTEVVGDVIAVVAPGRGVEGHQPEAGDPEPRQVVDLADQAAEVTDPVAVAVEVGLDVEAIDHGVLPPQVAGLVETHQWSL